jgi:transcriptional regulator with XRE-family HTH domain
VRPLEWERDYEMFRLRHIRGWSARRIARYYGLNPSRVGQILAKQEHFLGREGFHPVLLSASLAVDMRIAALTALGAPCEALAAAALAPRRERHPELFAMPLRQLDAIRDLLDTIGWEQPKPRQRPLEMDMRLHGWAVREALDEWVGIEQDAAAEHPRAGRRASQIAQFLANTALVSPRQTIEHSAEA